MPSVSILIVCYRSKDLIGPMLRGLFEHTQGVSFEVLLTDCSQDGTEAWVAEHYPSVRIISTNDNLGFAKGNNFLARHATGDKLLLINPDVIITDNAIGELVECSREFPDAGAWGGVTRLEDGRTDPSCQQTFPTLKRLFASAVGLGKRIVGGLSREETQARPVETLTGAFMMVDRERWESLGGFDETFFMYAEELDLCYRIRQQGRGIIMTPKAEIVHLVGGGSSMSPRRIEAITKAKMHYIRKHFGRGYAWVAGILLWMTAMNRAFAGSIRGGLGQERGRKLVQANWPLVRSPSIWWFGYGEK